MNRKFLYALVLVWGIAFTECSNKSYGTDDDSNLIPVNRFDIAMYQWIESDNPNDLDSLRKNYGTLFNLLGRSLFKTDITKSPEYFNILINFYSEPTLKSLYTHSLAFYAPDSEQTRLLKGRLTYGFSKLHELFPDMQIPAVYLHVSGFLQKIIIADSLISMSADMYLGNGYQLYEGFFEPYQRKNMVPERLAIDCLSNWLESEYPYRGDEKILLERMIYKGKIAYVMSLLHKDFTFANTITMGDGGYGWCKENESLIWTRIIEEKHLYTPDIVASSKYFLDMPASFIADDAPGNIGNFIGYRIVEAYMKRTKSTCIDLMNNNNAQEILKKSRYKPQ